MQVQPQVQEAPGQLPPQEQTLLHEQLLQVQAWLTQVLFLLMDFMFFCVF
ncbi:MAG: hypothetical protein JST67_11205 [Bacteroidetes bacterium]|nr:hypothetical protein [Bacteroidota bacterium]